MPKGGAQTLKHSYLMNKNILKKLALSCCLALASTHVMAQKSVDQMSEAFNNFTTKLLKNKQVTLVVNDQYEGGYIHKYQFDAPISVLQKFDNTMLECSSASFQSFVKTAGTESGSKKEIRLAYDVGNKSTYVFPVEVDNNYNMQLMRDPKDESMRYAYMLTWAKRGDRAVGHVVEIYGKDPQVPSTNKKDTELNEKPKTALEFMQAFGTLRSIYLKQNDELRRDLEWNGKTWGRKQSDKLPLVTAVANKISSLCANYIHLLSNPDKLLVQRTLRDMQSSANDKYVGNIFATAADNMSFKRKKP